MITDEEMMNLPEDPAFAFVECEKILRRQLKDSLEKVEGFGVQELYIEYINHVRAAARALELPYFNSISFPHDYERLFEFFQKFTQEVDFITGETRMRRARRTKEYSVALDSAARKKIHLHIAKIKGVLEKLEVSDQKRDALFTKVAALEAEVERTRTRFEVVSAFIIEASSVVGKAIDQLEPARKWVDSIAAIMGKAKEAEVEEQARLPRPTERKRIEDKTDKNQKGQSKPNEEFSDDIPF